MKSIFIMIVFLIANTSARCQLDQVVNEILSHPDIDNAQISISVRDNKGKTLFARADEVLLMPASTTKVITTCSAIGILGRDYRYKTTVGYRGYVLTDGTLDGDIIIIGSGDPSLGSNEMESSIGSDAILEQIVSAVESLRVTCIDGQILVDHSIFDDEIVNPGWSWDDLTNYYAGGVWGLNFSDNRYDVNFTRDNKADRPTDIKSINPSVPNLKIDNQVRTGPIGSGDNAYIQGSPYTNERFITGTIPPGSGTFSIQGSVPDPGLLLGFHVREELKNKNILSTGYGHYNKNGREISIIKEIYSQSLYKLAEYANRESENMYCDAFYKSIGAAHSGVGSWESANNSLQGYISKIGINTQGHTQRDGSGLSYRNRISPSFMTEFLSIHAELIGIKELKNLLPKVGQEGTVKRFLNGYISQDHSWLKSGSINAVIAYAGILQLEDDNHIFISVCSNGHSCSNRRARKQIERIIDEVYQHFSP